MYIQMKNFRLDLPYQLEPDLRSYTSMTSSKLLVRKMKLARKILWLTISILVSLLYLFVLRHHKATGAIRLDRHVGGSSILRLSKQLNEGFSDLSSSYKSLKTRLTNAMTPYCDLATYAQSQMKMIYTSVGESETQALARIQSAYIDMYACKDENASSRPSCSGTKPLDSPKFIPCTTYMNLPDWSDDGSLAMALNAIPNDLPDRISKEIDWYKQIVEKVQKALDAGNRPPEKLPESETFPSTNSSGKPWSITGFLDYSAPMDTRWSVEGFDGTCTPAQAATKIALAASECTMPTLDTQIPRVNSLLDSKALQAALAKCATLKGAMEKLKSDQQKARDGTLYSWQQDGPTKTFAKLPAGNRTDGLLSSLKQNQM